jgi:hypothetical protein
MNASVPADLPPALAGGTPYKIVWPTGRTGIRKTYAALLKLCRSKEDLPDWWAGVRGSWPDEYPVYTSFHYDSGFLMVYPDQICWDPAEAAEALAKLSIVEECGF